MLIPRYYFADDFRPFYAYFLSQPHNVRNFHKGDYLWPPNAPYEKIHYIITGAAMHYTDHTSGHRKIISFHGPGTVFPGYRPNDFRIELSLITVALSDMKVLEFSVPQFKAMFESNTALSEQVINWYSMYINRFLFETIHQAYNPSLTKLCNLLYLLTINQPANSGLVIDMTQDALAEILGMSRVQITRELGKLRHRGIVETSRGKLLITDLAVLASLCTQETL